MVKYQCQCIHIYLSFLGRADLILCSIVLSKEYIAGTDVRQSRWCRHCRNDQTPVRRKQLLVFTTLVGVDVLWTVVYERITRWINYSSKRPTFVTNKFQGKSLKTFAVSFNPKKIFAYINFCMNVNGEIVLKLTLRFRKSIYLKYFYIIQI